MAMRAGLPAYQFPDNALLNLNPINAAIADYRQREQQGVENRRADELLGMQRTRLGMDQARFAEDQNKRRVERIGNQMRVIDGITDPARRTAMWRSFSAANPDITTGLRSAGINPDDHMMAPRFLMAEAGAYDPLGEASARSAIAARGAATDASRAHAELYRAQAKRLAAPPAAAPPASDPLAGYGLSADGTLVAPSATPAAPDPFAGYEHTPRGAVGSHVAPGSYVRGLPVPMRLGGPQPYDEDQFMPAPWDGGGPTDGAGPPAGGAGRFASPVPLTPRPAPRMNLGGPVDDIEASMRLDEGRPRRGPDGVRVAQAGGGSAMPALAQQAFGRAGVTSPEVPGIVTSTGRTQRMDVPATREAAGQRAIGAASPEDQQRLLRFREEQAKWTSVYGRQPRAGYYYGPDGREIALTDKQYKGDREAQATAMLNWNKIDQASRVLLSAPLGYPQRAVQGLINQGEIGQAFADMKQAALGIAYALSGKQVAVAEMNNFMDAYGPNPLDSADRIQAKVGRLRQFYQALITASRGGEDYERAYAKAIASIGLKNPDGSLATGATAGPLGAPPINPETQRLKNKYGLE